MKLYSSVYASANYITNIINFVADKNIIHWEIKLNFSEFDWRKMTSFAKMIFWIYCVSLAIISFLQFKFWEK
jgi:hypothetical protein